MDQRQIRQLLEAARYRWTLWARPNQLPPPGNWSTWLLLSGRGFGKTRTGAEWVRSQVEAGLCRRIALVAPTAADARDVMIEGESGLLAVCPPWNKPRYEPSKRRLKWPNGAIATLYSAEEPDRLNGPQSDAAWCDELGVWPGADAWNMLLMGLRLGHAPRAVVTTTPKANVATLPLIKALLASTTTVVTRGSTYDNRANLAPSFFASIVRQYEGTRLGRAELLADMAVFEDAEDALWRRQTMIEAHRVTSHPELVRVVVGVDPASGSGTTGVVIAGRGKDGQGYVLADCSTPGSPDTWAKAVVTAYHVHHADRIVAEANQGGTMVEHVLKTIDRNVAYKPVHAMRGKQLRAEPVAALAEQGKIHHVGTFPDLEDEMCQWTPGDPSPDRLDALVHALTDLLVTAPPRAQITWG